LTNLRAEKMDKLMVLHEDEEGDTAYAEGNETAVLSSLASAETMFFVLGSQQLPNMVKS